MKKPAINIFLILAALAISLFLMKAGFALWSHKAEIQFTLNISPPQEPEEEEFCYGDYATIQEGIDILRDIRYDYIYNKMEQFLSELEARLDEIEGLAKGDISGGELGEECEYYREVVIAGFANLIEQYGDYIENLTEFYYGSSSEEQAAVPDFWVQRGVLWNLRTQLWNKRTELFNTVTMIWNAGMQKIIW